MSSFALCLQQCWWVAQGFFAYDKHNCVPGDRKQEGYIGMLCAEIWQNLWMKSRHCFMATETM